MNHELPLVTTLAVCLVFAFLGGLLALRLKLPPLVGYLVAGIAVGPFTPGVVANSSIAGELAEVGVMLLMFGVGMHFSLEDLLRVRKVAVPGAVLQIAIATGLGLALGKLWGWSLGAGLTLGLALSIASTVVLLRALESRGEVASELGRLAVGWLVVEDLVMVLVMVLLPALAGMLGGHAPTSTPGLGLSLLFTLLKVAGFVVLMLVVGARLLPWLLNRVERTGSRELFTLAVVVAAVGVAFGAAELFGVSFALGAFFAGLVVSASDHSHRAAQDTQPLQDAFAALFFVSVGMLFDPRILLREPVRVLEVLALVVVGKALVGFALARLLRVPRALALGVGAGLAQVGEFSFILAGLGVELGLFPEEGRGLVLAAAILSITLNPLLFRWVPRISPLPGA